MEEDRVISINNIEYIILDEIETNNTRYIYLSESENPENFMIRKLRIIDNNECIVNLDNEEEFDDALAAFYKKNHS